ncbi:hypothetical protein ACK323_04825 [Aeromonas enteropelogenes]|uniref:hypothetical protein n=1 Tax=Aeromonas enteropelogenes TaxID=29489 RepID=UPI003989084A
MNEQQQQQQQQQQKFEILVSYYAIPKKNKLNRFFHKNNSEVVQGEPFEWGVIIKNIGALPTPEAKIADAIIFCDATKLKITMDNDEIFVRSLNPGEEIKISLNNCKCYKDGALWAGISITPNDSNCIFITYQYDMHHNKNMLYSKDEDKYNQWADLIYIQNKMELLQSQTNNYILLLTFVTAWESIFGIKATLIKTLQGLGYIFIMMSDVMKFLVKIFI